MIDSWARGVMPMEMSVMTDQECEDMVDSISCGESVTLEGEIPMSPSQQNELVKSIYYMLIIYNDVQHFICSNIILVILYIINSTFT